VDKYVGRLGADAAIVHIMGRILSLSKKEPAAIHSFSIALYLFFDLF